MNTAAFPESDLGIRLSTQIAMLNAYVLAADPEVMALAERLLDESRGEEGDQGIQFNSAARGRAVWRGLVDRGRFLYSAHHAGLDFFKSPVVMAREIAAQGRSYGDCGSIAGLLLALLTSLGERAVPVLAVMRRGRPRGHEIEHIFLVYRTADGPVPMDPCDPSGVQVFGRTPPALRTEPLPMPDNMDDVPRLLDETVAKAPKEFRAGIAAQADDVRREFQRLFQASGFRLQASGRGTGVPPVEGFGLRASGRGTGVPPVGFGLRASGFGLQETDMSADGFRDAFQAGVAGYGVGIKFPGLEDFKLPDFGKLLPFPIPGLPGGKDDEEPSMPDVPGPDDFGTPGGPVPAPGDFGSPDLFPPPSSPKPQASSLPAGGGAVGENDRVGPVFPPPPFGGHQAVDSSQKIAFASPAAAPGQSFQAGPAQGAFLMGGAGAQIVHQRQIAGAAAALQRAADRFAQAGDDLLRDMEQGGNGNGGGGFFEQATPFPRRRPRPAPPTFREERPERPPPEMVLGFDDEIPDLPPGPPSVPVGSRPPLPATPTPPRDTGPRFGDEDDRDLALTLPPAVPIPDLPDEPFAPPPPQQTFRPQPPPPGAPNGAVAGEIEFGDDDLAIGPPLPVSTVISEEQAHAPVARLVTAFEGRFEPTDRLLPPGELEAFIEAVVAMQGREPLPFGSTQDDIDIAVVGGLALALEADSMRLSPELSARNMGDLRLAGMQLEADGYFGASLQRRAQAVDEVMEALGLRVPPEVERAAFGSGPVFAPAGWGVAGGLGGLGKIAGSLTGGPIGGLLGGAAGDLLGGDGAAAGGAGGGGGRGAPYVVGENDIIGPVYGPGGPLAHQGIDSGQKVAYGPVPGQVNLTVNVGSEVGNAYDAGHGDGGEECW